MLQYLLDEHLPGYHLPARRLSADTWSIDPVTCEIKTRYYEVSYPERLSNAVAISERERDYNAKYILGSDGSEYYVFTNERNCSSSSDPGHYCVRLNYCLILNPDVEDYLI